MAKTLLIIFLSLYLALAQFSTDSGLAFEVVAAEAQDANANVTLNDQEMVNATTVAAGTTQSLHGKDETAKEHGKNEPKLLKVRATVEEDGQKRHNETVKDDSADRHPKELKLQKDDKVETTTAEPGSTKAP